MDHWVYDSFTLYDHDYSQPSYQKILYDQGYKKIFGNWAVLQNYTGNPLEAKFKLVTLGGSTTSAIFESTWVKHLFDLYKEGINSSITVFNGGCGSYNSHCEFMKLSRDIFSIQPNHVISLSGVNDSIVPPYLSNGFANLLINDPQFTSGPLFNDLNLAFPMIDRSQRWIEEAVQMSSICNQYSSKFTRFLQPCLCSHNNPKDSLNLELSSMITKISDQLKMKDYEDHIFKFYSQASDILNTASNDCLIDISNILSSDVSFWNDARHQTDLGYKIIAENIFAHLNLTD